MAFGDNPALDKAMAINANRLIIEKRIAADPALAKYNAPDFILRAARWSYKQYGFGVADFEGYLAYRKEIERNPVRLYNIDIKLWQKIRADIFQRDDYTCAYCGQRGGVLEVDHIQPVSKGGTNAYDNLTTACLKCNRRKRDKSAEEFRALLASEKQ